jgi:hypothetical protein
VTYFSGSGLTVDRLTGALLAEGTDPGPVGPVLSVAADRIDRERAFEGVAPEVALFFGSVESFLRLNERALARYGLDLDDPEEADDELDALRRRMMAAHPDRGGTEADFAIARAAWESARRRRGRID